MGYGACPSTVSSATFNLSTERFTYNNNFIHHEVLMHLTDVLWKVSMEMVSDCLHLSRLGLVVSIIRNNGKLLFLACGVGCVAVVCWTCLSGVEAKLF
jgi:hypothetical protein